MGYGDIDSGDGLERRGLCTGIFETSASGEKRIDQSRRHFHGGIEMGIAVLLAEVSGAATEEVSQEAMIEQIYQAVQDLPAGGLRLIMIVSIISLVGILWLVHRQQKLARNQVKLAGILEEMAERSSK